jgi:hypothetical protein
MIYPARMVKAANVPYLLRTWRKALSSSKRSLFLERREAL